MRKVRAGVKKFSLPQLTKNLIFFLCYSSSLIILTYFPSTLLWLFLPLLIIIFWKIFFGLSWFNFIFFLISVFQIKFLATFFKFGWLLIFTIILIFLLFKKIFSRNLEENKKWRLLSFYYLFFFWILGCLGCYNYLNLNFSLSFLLFTLGVIIYSLMYFVMEEKKFVLNDFILVIFNLEVFWLINYLTLSLPYLAILIFINYWLTLYFYFLPQVE